MAADSVTLLLAGFAAWIAGKPSSQKHTYGFGRAEVIVAWFSSLSLIAVTIGILIEAFRRFYAPHAVSGQAVIIVAIMGFTVNLIIALLLNSGEKTLNTRAALLHVLSDLLGSIIALISGVIIYFTHWNTIDPILSVVICILILFSTINLLRESLLVLMEGVPKHIDSNEVTAEMCKIHGISTIHDLHIWTLTSGMTLLTAHVVIENFHDWPRIIENLHKMLDCKFKINHATLQPETTALTHNCTRCD
jgi:cobalt-zinc-cadmium efflux system protein